MIRGIRLPPTGRCLIFTRGLKKKDVKKLKIGVPAEFFR